MARTRACTVARGRGRDGCPRAVTLASSPAEPMTVKSCPTCGLEDAGDRDFCGGCGSYLRWEEDPETTDTAVLTPATDEEPEATPMALEPLARREEVAMTPIAAPPPPVAAEPEDAVQVTVRVPGRDEDPSQVDVATVDPGGHATLTATVRNQSGVVEGYSLRVDGLPTGWYSTTPDVVHLVPFGADSGTFEGEFTIAITPPRSVDARAGAWPVQVVAARHPDGATVASAPAQIIMGAFERFESRIRPERVRGNGSARFSVPIRNLGNAPLPVSFRAEDPEDEVTFSFEPPHLEVAPGEDARAVVTARARQPRTGAERERRITVFVDAPGQSLSGDAVFVQRPRATSGRLTLWRVLAALLASALLIASAFLAWNDLPQSGVCLRDADDCLRYNEFAESFLGFDEVGFVKAGDVAGLVSFATSAGLVTIFLGLLVLLGLLRGSFAWAAGVLAVGFAIVLMLISDAGVGAGLWVALLGGVLAIVAGALATVAQR